MHTQFNISTKWIQFELLRISGKVNGKVFSASAERESQSTTILDLTMLVKTFSLFTFWKNSAVFMILTRMKTFIKAKLKKTDD